MPKKSHRITVAANGEWTDVTMDIFRSKRAVKVYPDPKFVPLDLSIAEARDLAARLTAAADGAEKYNRDLDAYFAAHPVQPLEVSDDPAP